MSPSRASPPSRTKDFFPWSEKYSVHIRIIDNDHKNLFEIINTLHAGIKRGLSEKELGIAIAGLVRYVDEHFEREEALMQEHHYPGLTKHRDIHRELVRKVYAIRKVQLSRPARIDLDKMMRFLELWLVEHILNIDMKYVPYLHGEVPAAGEHGDDDHAGREGLAFVSKKIDAELKEMSLKVPAHYVEVLHRCALLLRREGDEAHAIAEITDPIASMTTDEAERICMSLLK